MFESLVKNGKARQQSDELHETILLARQERAALGTLLEQLHQRGGQVTDLAETIDRVRRKSAEACEQLDTLGGRIAGLDDRVAGLATVDKQVQGVSDMLRQAQQAADMIAGPDGQLQRHREAMQRLWSESVEVRTGIETLKTQRSALDDTREGLHRSQSELREATGRADDLMTELDRMRETASRLEQDFASSCATAAEARRDANAAKQAAEEVDAKLSSLETLQDLAATTEERLKALNVLAEHVTVKTKALDSQKITIERAVSEMNRLNQMVWAMEQQIARLNEGNQQAARTAEVLAQIDTLASEAHQQLEAATQRQVQFARETARLEGDGGALLQDLRAHLERLRIEKKSFDSYEQRVTKLQRAIDEAEGRLQAIGAKSDSLEVIGTKAEALATSIQQLSAEVDDLSQKRSDLAILEERLTRAEALAREADVRYAGLQESRRQLEEFRAELEQHLTTHATTAELSARLSAERTALEASGEKMARFSSQIPGLEGRVSALLEQFDLLDTGGKHAERLRETVVELEAGLARASERMQFVETVERRLDGLHVLNTEIGHRFETQLQHRAELEAMGARYEELASQITDAHHKLGAIAVIQDQFPALLQRADALGDGIAGLDVRLEQIRRTDSDLRDQENRLVELVSASRQHQQDATERAGQIEALAAELQRAAAIKEDLLGELASVQVRHQETAARVAASEEQLRHVEDTCRQLDERRSELLLADRKIAATEAQIAELSRLASDTDRKLQSIADRDGIVAAAKNELESVQAIANATKADVHYLVEQHDMLQGLRSRIDDVMHTVRDTEERMALIGERRKLIADVQGKTERIVTLLDDVRLNLEMIAEQKALVDHVAEQVAQLEFSVQQSQNTMRALQQEREGAERMAEAIRQLRAREDRVRRAD